MESSQWWDEHDEEGVATIDGRRTGKEAVKLLDLNMRRSSYQIRERKKNNPNALQKTQIHTFPFPFLT